jgi:hypothetical protein
MNLDRIRKQLNSARRKKIKARVLGIGQDRVSRLEQRSDLLISTLRGYVEAMGGQLSLIAEFPNQAPVVLTGLAAHRVSGNRLSANPPPSST